MNIACATCNLNLGEIRDATIRKGTKHLCPSCLSGLEKKAAAAAFAVGSKSDVVDDIFGTIFGGRK